MKAENKCRGDSHWYSKTISSKQWHDNNQFSPPNISIHDLIDPLRTYEIRTFRDNVMGEKNPRHPLKVGLPEAPHSPYDEAASAYQQRIPYDMSPYDMRTHIPWEPQPRGQEQVDPQHAYAHRYAQSTTRDIAGLDHVRTGVAPPASVRATGLPNRGNSSGGCRPPETHLRGRGASLRRDWVDGDEPGTLIDSELENLTQPHMVITQPRYPRFASEETRMTTFTTWRNQYPSVVLLVLSGFFFLGGRDSVQCFHCGVILHSWEESDIPDEEHKKHSPNCVFMRLKARGLPGSPSNYQQPGVNRNHVTDSQRPVAREPAPRRQGEQQQDIMKTVAGLGHSMDVVEKAMKHLQLSGKRNIDTNMLVDAVFEVEDNEDLGEHLGGSDEPGACGGRPAESSEVKNQEKQDQTIKSDGSVRPQENTTQTDLETKTILEKAKQLERENEDLRKQTTCRVCFERPATEVFLPCGHLACCEECSGRLSECPYCRKKILRTVHVFLP